MAPLDEVGLEQALLHLELAAVRLGVVDQLVGEHGVGVLERVVVVVQADRLGDAGDPLEHPLDPVGRESARDEVVLLAAVEVDRGVGRELEGVVLDLDRPAELRGSRLELALADVAPGAGDVATRRRP